MYFKKERTGKDPFLNFGKKRNVYWYFFKKGTSMGFDMYLASGPETYLGKLSFKNPAFFNGTEFTKISETITADAIYDRSGGTSFPTFDIDNYVLNCSAFKILCNDKNQMYEHFGKFMPRSFKARNSTEFLTALKEFNASELVVLKPAKGLGGNGIIIDNASTLKKEKLKKDTEYVIQEFADTSCGIEGLVKEKHDLRVVIANGKIVLSHIRTPKKGSYLANAAQGGSLKEIPLEKIPKEVLSAAKKIKALADKKFHKPIYSIDFGITKRGPLVFELNDQIGFPRDGMKNAKNFVNEVLNSLANISKSGKNKLSYRFYQKASDKEYLPQMTLLQKKMLPRSQWGEKYLEQFLKNSKEHPLCVLCIKKNEIVGFALGKFNAAKKSFVLSTLVVDSNAHGKGIGKNLTERFIETAFEKKSARKIIVNFRDSNNLEAFYAKLGFGKHHLSGTYKNGEIKHEMEIKRP